MLPKKMEEIPLQEINDPAVAAAGARLYMLRLDLAHPTVPGNKWFKLKYNLQEAQRSGTRTLLTFGGAYSNHIAAVAAAGKEYGFHTIGIIRGEEHTPLNNVLERAKANGMQLEYVSREAYLNKTEQEFINELGHRFGKFYLLPEGGTNALAVQGCAEICSHIRIPFQRVCCAVGTGGTIAGLISSLDSGQQATGFAVLKGASFLKGDIEALLARRSVRGSWGLELDYHFGGYAKSAKALDDFILSFGRHNNIPLEPVYTGKMMYGIVEMAKAGSFRRGEVIIALHTGGL